MYSNSSSYLGGGTAGRAPFGQQQQQQQPYGQQGANAFGAQPTGYGGGLQPQYTGYPGQQQQQLQPQATGYPPQQQLQPQATGYPMQQFQPQPTGFQAQQQPLQAQATGYPGQQQQLRPQTTGYPGQFGSGSQQQPFQPVQQTSSPAPQTLKPQPTGMTSSQMADSFRSSPAPQQRKPKAASSAVTAKVPNIRLSFITADNQEQFKQLFLSAVGNESTLSGDKSREVLMRSNLPGNTLGQIWYVNTL